jgi:hypothetical protein
MTTIKIIAGYVEMPVIRTRGGRAATRASNIKLQSADRLESLVSGEAVGRGVENTDDMKAGTLTPAIRIDILKARIEGFDARLQRMATDIMVVSQEGATSLKLQGMDDAIRALRARRENAVSDLISIMRGLTESEEE